jgi:hypothetical protein
MELLNKSDLSSGNQNPVVILKRKMMVSLPRNLLVSLKRKTVVNLRRKILVSLKRKVVVSLGGFYSYGQGLGDLLIIFHIA